MTTNFDPKTCTLTEMNRELKRLASRKCRAKTDEDRISAEKSYRDLVSIKNSRFGTGRKSYFTLSKDEIESLDLESTIKAIKSLQSRRCVYPDKKDETLRVENIYQEHRIELMRKIQLEKLQKSMK